jgi:DNA-binding transcriptional ArsR family regulator
VLDPEASSTQLSNPCGLRRVVLTYITVHLYAPPVHAFDVLGDPVRRRILELLAEGELTSGAIAEVVQAEFGISQPAVSQHLKVLRESGFASVRPDGARRLYAVESAPLQEVDMWLDHFRRFWTQRLDSLATELARSKRERRLSATTTIPPKEYPQ